MNLFRLKKDTWKSQGIVKHPKGQYKLIMWPALRHFGFTDILMLDTSSNRLNFTAYEDDLWSYSFMWMPRWEAFCSFIIHCFPRCRLRYDFCAHHCIVTVDGDQCGVQKVQNKEKSIIHLHTPHKGNKCDTKMLYCELKALPCFSVLYEIFTSLCETKQCWYDNEFPHQFSGHHMNLYECNL